MYVSCLYSAKYVQYMRNVITKDVGKACLKPLERPGFLIKVPLIHFRLQYFISTLLKTHERKLHHIPYIYHLFRKITMAWHGRQSTLGYMHPYKWWYFESSSLWSTVVLCTDRYFVTTSFRKSHNSWLLRRNKVLLLITTCVCCFNE